HLGDDRALADARGAGEHRQPREARRTVVALVVPPRLPAQTAPPVAWSAATFSPPNAASSARRWLAPSPRTRRIGEISSRSMIFAARALPTPGRDSSTAET